MRARIIRAYIAKPKNIPLISLISQYTRPRDKRDKRVIFPLNSHIYAHARVYCIVDFLVKTLHHSVLFTIFVPKYRHRASAEVASTIFVGKIISVGYYSKCSETCR